MSDSNTHGEVNLLLKDVREMTESLMTDLKKVDVRLADIQRKALDNEMSMPLLITEVRKIRAMLGTIEQEEMQELKIEDATQSLLDQMHAMINKCLE